MIDDFRYDYQFLSNFYYSPVYLDCRIYKTLEHAYQAAKTLNEADRLKIWNCHTPNQAKLLGKKVKLRPNWDEIKIDVMLALLRQKFSSPTLRALLLQTGEEQLVEGNHWGDTYWGVCKGVGENHLGKLLMQVRKEIRDVIETKTNG